MESNNPFNQNSHFNKPTQVLRPMGSVLKTDENGYLISETSPEKIQKEFLPVINDSIELGKKMLGDELHSIYLRGSAAKGELVKGISDLDFKFIIQNEPSAELKATLKAAFDELAKTHPEVIKIDQGLTSLERFNRGRNPLNKYQTICMYGEDLSKNLPPLKPGKETRTASKVVLKDIADVLPLLENETNPAVIKKESIKICKQIIRSAHDLVAEKLQRFTRDIYPAYEGAIQVYPEQKTLLHRIAEIAVFGSTNKQELVSLIQQSKAFIEPELITVFGAK